MAANVAILLAAVGALAGFFLFCEAVAALVYAVRRRPRRRERRW